MEGATAWQEASIIRYIENVEWNCNRRWALEWWWIRLFTSACDVYKSHVICDNSQPWHTPLTRRWELSWSSDDDRMRRNSCECFSAIIQWRQSSPIQPQCFVGQNHRHQHRLDYSILLCICTSTLSICVCVNLSTDCMTSLRRNINGLWMIWEWNEENSRRGMTHCLTRQATQQYHTYYIPIHVLLVRCRSGYVTLTYV